MRARFAPAWLLAVSLLATTVFPAIALASPDGALAALLLAMPWAPPLVAAVAGAVATRSAFGALDLEPAISARREPLETVAYALLANALIDAGLCVVAALATLVTTRGEL